MLIKKAKRILAGVLSAVIVITGLPVSALAAPIAAVQEKASEKESSNNGFSMKENSGEHFFRREEGEALKLEKESGIDFAVYGSGGKSDTAFTIGEKISYDFSEMPANATASAISFVWHSGGKEEEIGREEDSGLHAIDFSSLEADTSFHYTVQPRDCNQECYMAILLYDGENIKETYQSNKLTPIVPLKGTAAAGNVLSFELENFGEDCQISVTWFYKNSDGANVELASQTEIPMDFAEYYVKDADVGRKICAEYTVFGDSAKYQTAWTETLEASEVIESVRITKPELSVGSSITGEDISGTLEGFTEVAGSRFTGDRELGEVSFSIMSSEDASTETPADDIELACESAEKTESIYFPSYQLKQADQGRYLYLKLTSGDLRRPVYISELVGPVTEKKLPLTISESKVNGYVYTRNLPPECYSKGAYTYRYLRTTGEAGAKPVVVKSGSNSGSTLQNEEYCFTDADINCYLYVELTSIDGTKYTSEKTDKIAPRNLFLLNDNAASAGEEVKLAASDTEMSETVKADYVYYLTETEEATDNTQKTKVLSGSVTANRDGSLDDIIPSYLIKDSDAGKYLHLELTISGYTYTLHVRGTIIERHVSIYADQALEGNIISVRDYGLISGTLDSRYQWLRKSAPDVEGAKDASVGAGTEEIAAEGKYTGPGSVPDYKIAPEDAGKYIYLKIITGDEKRTYYSQTSVGPAAACPLLTGKVTISGKAVSGEKLTAMLDGKTAVQGVGIEWYHVGEVDPLFHPSESSWEYTLTEEDSGFQVYARAVGDGTAFRGAVSSARTDVVLSQLSAEVTGIKAVKAELRNQGRIGFITELGDNFADWEKLGFDVTVYGVTSLPKDFAVGISISGTLYIAENPKGVPGTDSIVFQNLTIPNPDLKPGSNIAEVSVGKILYEAGSDRGIYEAVNIDPAFLNVEAQEPMQLTLYNALNEDGQVEVAEGSSTSLLLSTEEGAVLHYFLETEAAGISVDEKTGVINAASGAASEADVIAAAVKGNSLGIMEIPVKTVAKAVGAEKLALSFEGETDHDRIRSELEMLSTGYYSDPSKSNEELYNELWLDYVITPEDATKNYVVEWSSSNPDAAVVSSDGRVAVRKPGAEVTVTAQVKGTQIKDSITFTTATPKYDPKEIYFQTKKVTLKEQTYQPLTNLKVKYLVNGKTNRTLKLQNSYFEFSSSNEAVVRVDQNGLLFAAAPGEAVVTAKLLGTSIVKEIPVTVKDKEYVFVSFVLNGHYVEAVRNAKGVLEAEVTLYEGTDVPAKLEYSLDYATACIVSLDGEVISREAVLTDQVLKINKKYKTNVPVSYMLKLKNDQKLKLQVTIANTQPTYVRSMALYNSLDEEAPVTFRVYPGTKVRSVAVLSGSPVSVTSWAQNSRYVTVWVKCEENIKPSKKLNTVFEFETADLVSKESLKKTVTAPLRVESLPKAAFAPVYITAEAFSKDGYTLNNSNEQVYNKNDWMEEQPEFTDVLDNYKTGFYTVYTKITDHKGGKLSKNLLTVSDGRLRLAEGVRPEEIKPGVYQYDVSYYYQAVHSGRKTEEATAVVSITFSHFEFDKKSLELHMAYGAKDERKQALYQEFSLKLYSHFASGFGISKADLKKGIYMDQRYTFDSVPVFELYNRETGKEVEGVAVFGDGRMQDDLGMYESLGIEVESTSELLKDGAKIYPAGTFELRCYMSDTAVRPAVVLSVPEIAVNADPVVIKPEKPQVFNQTAFKAQRSEFSYTASKDDFKGRGIEVVMTKAPQMEDPFHIYINEENGNIAVEADTRINRMPAAGTYSYSCVMDNGLGGISKEFTLNVQVKKAVGDIIVKAKISGKLNPYYHNLQTKEGCVVVTFSSNIPALDIGYNYGSIMETPKKAKDTVSYKDVQGQKINVRRNGRELIYYPVDPVYFDSECNYVPTDIGLNIGYYDEALGQEVDLYNASFKQLKPLTIKEELKIKSLDSQDVSLSDFEGDTPADIFGILFFWGNKPVSIGPADLIDPLKQLNGESLYRQIDGEFVRVGNNSVAPVETLVLDAKSQKNFELLGYERFAIWLHIINEEIRKEGVHKLTFQMIPSSAASYEKQQVYDKNGNPLYIMTEDFDGRETYSLCTIEVPKRVKITQELRLHYYKDLTPAEK